jgi:hypothetical protein
MATLMASTHWRLWILQNRANTISTAPITRNSWDATTIISNTPRHPTYSPGDKCGGQILFRLMTLSSSTWKAENAQLLVNAEYPTMILTTKDLWHDNWQLSQGYSSITSCQNSLALTHLTPQLSMSWRT